MLTMTRDFSFDQLQLIKSFFTDSEWNAIDSALADYQDYGEIEGELTSSIGDKMTEMFKIQGKGCKMSAFWLIKPEDTFPNLAQKSIKK